MLSDAMNVAPTRWFQPVELVYNLRSLENDMFFSTARFLSPVKQGFHGQQVPTMDAVRKIYQEYSSELKSTWDVNRADHLTKKKLFEQALAQFIDQGVYLKLLNLCTFYDAKLGTIGMAAL